MPSQINLDEVCGDVMSMGLNDNEDAQHQSKSATGSGVGQNSSMDN